MTTLLKNAENYPLIASVMVVDDQLTSRIILESIIKSIGSNVGVRTFDNALSALRIAEQEPPDLIITDYKMPELDGVKFTRRLRALPDCVDVPIIMVTVAEERSVLYQGLEAGATDFLTKPLDHYECKVRCRNLLTIRRQQKIISNRASALETQYNQTLSDIRQREETLIGRLIASSRFKDNLGATDNPPIGRMAALIAAELGMEADFCRTIETAAPLYDIGKASLPDSLLVKQGPLQGDEMELMKTHTLEGYELLKDSDSPYLQMAAQIALHHHESHDGGGYPHGLTGEDIPIAARIVAVVQTYKSLVSDRPFRCAWTHEEALQELQRRRGKHLDPACVDAFLKQSEQIQAVSGEDSPQDLVNNF